MPTFDKAMSVAEAYLDAVAPDVADPGGADLNVFVVAGRLAVPAAVSDLEPDRRPWLRLLLVTRTEARTDVIPVVWQRPIDGTAEPTWDAFTEAGYPAGTRLWACGVIQRRFVGVGGASHPTRPRSSIELHATVIERHDDRPVN
jgi:hypothetical protein